MSSNYEIWFMLEDDPSTAFQIPVNPEGYNYSRPTNDKVMQRVGGESAILKMGGAPRTLSFSSVFPAGASDNLEIAPSALKAPHTYEQLLSSYKEDSRRVHVIITGTNINDYFRISSFNTEEKGGDVGSVYYSITLRTSTKIKVTSIDSMGLGVPAGGQVLFKVTKKFNNWKKIAKKFYGSAKKSNVKKLKKANGNRKKPGVGNTVIIP